MSESDFMRSLNPSVKRAMKKISGKLNDSEETKVTDVFVEDDGDKITITVFYE